MNGRLGPSWRTLTAGALSVVTISCIAVVLAALAVGYRPVVIKTASMGDAAPPGSLIVAAPRASEDVAVGDILVMRRPGAPPITHRVIEIEQSAIGPRAITQGDANPAPDAVPYALGDDELVAAWVTPGVGRAVEAIRDPRFVLAALGGVLMVATVFALRRIWTSDADHGRTEHRGRPLPPPLPPTRTHRDAAFSPPIGAPPAVGPRRLAVAVETHDPGTGALTAWASVPAPGGDGDDSFSVDPGSLPAMDPEDPAGLGLRADRQMSGAP